MLSLRRLISPTAAAPARQSLARRIALSGALALAVVLLGISALMSWMQMRQEREQAQRWVGEKAQAVADAADAMDATARLLVDKFSGSFVQQFGQAFHLDAAGELLHGDEALAGNFAAVDKFQRDTGGVATVFVRRGGDFLRIATSLRKENGERAVGTQLGTQHPAHAAMLAGQPYVGRALLFGKPYMTQYQPVRDAAGQVVGILFIGFDLTPFNASLAQQVAAARFFDSGGLYVVVPGKTPADAVLLMHARDAGKKLADLPVAGDLLAQLEDAPQGVLMAAPRLLATQGDDHWLVARKSRANGWWVIAEVSDAEALQGLWANLAPVWALLGGAVVALGLGLAWMTRAWVARPLAGLRQAVTALSQGDLSQSFAAERRDEVGELVGAVEQMRQRFEQTLGQVRGAVDAINLASGEIAAGNQDLSARTELAASSLQQTAASAEQLSRSVEHNAASAGQAERLAQEASSAAGEGQAAVQAVVASMDEISQASRQIGEISGLIDGIAFQTNILALNAAVEAARAGEEGRGFAVVAGEVRALAQRSAEAAGQIKRLIEGSVARVGVGAEQVGLAGQSMQALVQQVGRVSGLLQEIGSATREQNSGIGQVSQAVGQLDRSTQENAALVEQSSAAAASLNQQAQQLLQALAFFRLGARTL
jgi:methyl-accepting chemotaxis protein-2 (aspartate sensor receptor)